MMNSNKKIKYYIETLLAVIMTIISIILCVRVVTGLADSIYLSSMYLDIMGMLVAGILITGLAAEKGLTRLRKSMFRMIFILIVLFFLDSVTSYMEGNVAYVLAVKFVNTIACICEDLLVYSYWMYIKEELELDGIFKKIADKICIFVIGINIVLDILNWKWGFLFTVSEDAYYMDSPSEFIGDLAIIAVFLIAAIAIINDSKKRINAKLVLLSFIIFPTIAYDIGMFTQEYLWLEPAYLLSVLLIYIRIFWGRGKKLAEQEALLTKQSMALMISQIQPHFLYNVLTTISNLCVTNPEEAEETTILFSQYLRTNLDSLRNDEPVPFATELNHVKTYVELEKKRFGEKLNVEYDINEQNFKVPSLGLQPIVENSIKHGIRGKNSPGTVKISSNKVDKGYMVIIEDDGVGFDMNMPAKEDGRSHVGMTNVQARLKQMVNAKVSINSSPGNGCRTEIFIPETE